jgi:SAM-dependent methyltransferase
MSEKKVSSCCGSGTTTEQDKIREEVRKRYAELVSKEKSGSSCCGPTSTNIEEQEKGKFAKWAGYTDEELSQLPEDASANSFGCGNPLAFTEVKPGDVVLDLGSGAGIDVFLAAKKVGKKGKVIGLDMTSEMIDKAKLNAYKAGADNVEFRLGVMEEMPIDNASVDWIISNCVINLSPDKRQVFKEAFRVLKPGGKLLVSDIVTNGLRDIIDPSQLDWASCVGGALEEEEYLKIIHDVGFTDVKIKGRTNVGCFLAQSVTEGKSPEPQLTEEALNDRIISLQVSATKPE